jgi:hypothetical protein
MAVWPANLDSGISGFERQLSNMNRTPDDRVFPLAE